MIIVIVGPTGVGKTKLSVALAKHFNLEIINGDSMQVYQGMDIGTAKIKEEEMAGIKHHLFSYVSPDKRYSVEQFQKDVRRLFDSLKTAILVGGTGLYLKAALYDYQFEPQVDVDLSLFEAMDGQALYDYVCEIDPEDAKKMHPNNRQRMLRAIQVYLGTGHNKTWHISKQQKKPAYDHVVIGLTMGRDQLYQQIDKRVDTMIEQGLEKEVRHLDQAYQLKDTTAIKGIGYQSFYDYIHGKMDYETCISQIKQDSRRLAKRQYTWFKHQMDVTWFDVDLNQFYLTIQAVIKYLEEVLS